MIFLLSALLLLFQAVAGTVENNEAELDRAISIYESNYGGLRAPDMTQVGSNEFRAKLEDMKGMEARLDTLIKSELDEIANTELRFAQLAKSGSPLTRERAIRVEALHAKYLESRVEYGQAKDYKRYAAFTDLFFETQKLYEAAAPVARPNVLARFTTAARKVGRLMNLAVRLSIPAFQMLLSAFQVSRMGFGQSVDRFFGAWGRASGLRVEVQNADILKNQERIRIFIPTHRDANLDAVAFSALNVENPVVFGALNLKNHPIFGMRDHPMVKPIIDALENNDTFILAATKEKPLDKFLRLIREGKVQNVLNYAEGQVGLGIKESRPVRENFSELLLKTLVDNGVDFELVPVTYVNGAQYFEYHNEIDYIKTERGQEKLLVNVHQPIRSDQIRRFFEKYGEKDFNTYLRMNWLFDLQTDQDLVLGQGRWSSIQEAFGNKISAGRTCGGIRALEALFDR